MKNNIREKFKNKIFVKPLYRKLRNSNKIKPKVLVTVDTNFNLDGQGFSVKRQIVSVNNVSPVKDNKENKVLFPVSCEKFHRNQLSDKFDRRKYTTKTFRNRIKCERKMLHTVGSRITDNTEIKDGKTNKLVQAEDKAVNIETVPNSWLRLYPMPKLTEESVWSVILRCILCQLGLSSFLILWTIVWVFVIHSFEGPYEMKVSLDFEREQNQLVIDLATELRQITPVSPKWKDAIEKRIQDERSLTLQAVAQGARIHPGQFWDLSGTFLFTIYVMTALGFGAPVPHTIWGRSSTLLYAFIAIPTHICLIMNASTCIVVHVEAYINQFRNRCYEKKPFIGRTNLDNSKDSPNCSRDSEVLQAERNGHRVVKTIMRCLGVVGACHSVPLALIVYYICGAIVFGILREKTSFEVIMFPLEFTTTGGLEHVKGHVRIIYGFYVEGAMILLACALAAFRRHSSAAINNMSEKYRLFASEQ